MLIGYPTNYRSLEEIGDTIKCFGRLMFWQRENVLARVIIKARVIDFIDIPHYIVDSEGDDFECIFFTVQCEILQQNILGGGPQDEDIPPGGLDDNFVYQGLGLALHPPFWPQPQHVGQNQNLQLEDNQEGQEFDEEDEVDMILDEPGVGDQPAQADEHENQISISARNLSNLDSSRESEKSVDGGPALPDLNASPPVMDIEIALDPVHVPGPEPELDNNFLVDEINEDELMSEEELLREQLLQGQQGPSVGPSNLNINLALIDQPVKAIPDPSLIDFLSKAKTVTSRTYPDL